VTAAQSGFDHNGIAPGDGIENVTVGVYAFTDTASGTQVGNTTTDANDSHSIIGISVTSASNHTVEVTGTSNFSANQLMSSSKRTRRPPWTSRWTAQTSVTSTAL
jgi:hypothetical protein